MCTSVASARGSSRVSRRWRFDRYANCSTGECEGQGHTTHDMGFGLREWVSEGVLWCCFEFWAGVKTEGIAVMSGGAQRRRSARDGGNEIDLTVLIEVDPVDSPAQAVCEEHLPEGLALGEIWDIAVALFVVPTDALQLLDER